LTKFFYKKTKKNLCCLNISNVYTCNFAQQKNYMQFKNKVVVITGGSDGIGKALVETFLAEGAKVATCGRNYDKLYLLQSTYPGKPLMIQTADVSKEQDCKLFIDAVIKTYTTIDILINNAGISMRALFKDVAVEALKKVMDINFWGAVYFTQQALPYIQKNKGSIVSISSIAGYRGLPGRSGYSASKFAMNGWMESLRVELLKEGVTVLTVCPGFTTSNIRNAALNSKGESHGETPMDEGAMMSSEECANHIKNAIIKKRKTLILTFTGNRTVWMNKLLPSVTDNLVYKFFFKNNQLVQ
jgi:short-subunit dehydrogenase